MPLAFAFVALALAEEPLPMPRMTAGQRLDHAIETVRTREQAIYRAFDELPPLTLPLRRSPPAAVETVEVADGASAELWVTGDAVVLWLSEAP